MNKLKKMDTAFWSRRFFITAILFSLFALSAQFAVNGQTPYSLKFIKVQVFNNLTENGSITAKDTMKMAETSR